MKNHAHSMKSPLSLRALKTHNFVAIRSRHSDHPGT